MAQYGDKKSLSPEQKDRAERQRHWINEITEARKKLEAWHSQGDKVIDKYLDKRGRGEKRERRFNLFNTNTNILISALLARIPKPEVARRFRDPNDHAGRVAANILQRAIATESDLDGYLTTTSKDIIKDRLIPGLGVAWIRYVPETKEQDFQISEDLNEELSEEQGASPIITDEHTPAEHIHWKDFLWQPGRTWNEVSWVARRAFLSKDEFKERFPNAGPLASPEGSSSSVSSAFDEAHKEDEIEVWEIWCKTSKKVYFFCEHATSILETKDDPLGLPHFFPCPKPLIANASTSSLVPAPDYVLVQDQYEDLNELHARRSNLIRACKVAGVYDAENSQIKDVFAQEENRLVPVQNWASFADKGGLAGSISFVPLAEIAGVIAQLDEAIEQIKGQIQELTGISDIVRGSTSPYETAAAQGMKAQYASLRLQTQQTEVAEFFSEMFAIKAFLMAKFYSPETLVRKAGSLPQEDYQYIPAAINLIKNELLAYTNVVVSVDQLQAPNTQQLAQETAQVMTSIANLVGQAMPVIQAMPESKSLFLALAKKSVSTMPGARDIEGLIDQELTRLLGPQESQPEKPDPAAQQAQAQQAAQQAQMQMEQAKLQQAMQIEQAKAQVSMQAKQMEIDAEMRIKQMQIENDTATAQAKFSIEQQKLELDQRRLRLEELKAVADTNGALDTSELEAPVGLGMQTQREGLTQTLMQFMEAQQKQMQTFMAAQQAANAQLLQTLVATPEPPTVVDFQRDAAGKVVGAVIQ